MTLETEQTMAPAAPDALVPLVQWFAARGKGQEDPEALLDAARLQGLAISRPAVRGWLAQELRAMARLLDDIGDAPPELAAQYIRDLVRAQAAPEMR